MLEMCTLSGNMYTCMAMSSQMLRIKSIVKSTTVARVHFCFQNV